VGCGQGPPKWKHTGKLLRNSFSSTSGKKSSLTPTASHAGRFSLRQRQKFQFIWQLPFFL
jgi:hypothetical protein